MAEADQVTTTGDQDQKSLGWRSALPDEIKEHDWIKTFQKPGDFAKEAIGVKTERDALKAKLENTMPKLKKDATDEERQAYHRAMGALEKPEEYEIPYPEGVVPDKMSPQDKELRQTVVGWLQGMFHKNHLTKDQAKGIQEEFQAFAPAFAENVKKQKSEALKQETEVAATKLKAELGDKYDAGFELAKRFWRDNTDVDFDQVFEKENNPNRFRMISFLLKVAKKTGEDTSLTGTPSKGSKESGWFDNTPSMAAK